MPAQGCPCSCQGTQQCHCRVRCFQRGAGKCCILFMALSSMSESSARTQSLFCALSETKPRAQGQRSCIPRDDRAWGHQEQLRHQPQSPLRTEIGGFPSLSCLHSSSVPLGWATFVPCPRAVLPRELRRVPVSPVRMCLTLGCLCRLRQLLKQKVILIYGPWIYGRYISGTV